MLSCEAADEKLGVNQCVHGDVTAKARQGRQEVLYGLRPAELSCVALHVMDRGNRGSTTF